MSDHPSIVADRLRVHGHLHQHELDVLLDRWTKLDQRLQSFTGTSIDIDLHVNERDTKSQHVTLDLQVGGFPPFIATSSSPDIDRACIEVRDEVIRQLTDAKNRTEPRNNRQLRSTARKPSSG
jgi:ribosome-associated translation inhibitor RaiA